MLKTILGIILVITALAGLASYQFQNNPAFKENINEALEELTNAPDAKDKLLALRDKLVERNMPLMPFVAATLSIAALAGLWKFLARPK